jgi:hypothetical protein
MSTRFVVVAAFGFLAACEEKGEVVVTETRRPTVRDENPRLFASSDERFRNTKPSPVTGDMPDAWREVPPTEFRLLNYRFGDQGDGEVWVSLSAGTVLDNVNRWLAQFGVEAISDPELAKLRTIPMAGASGVWVEAEGEYASGMGAPPKPGFGLAGVVGSVDNQILTVKMVGPRAEVEAAKADLETFVRSLRMAE